MSPTPPRFPNLPKCKSYVAKLFNDNNIEPKKTMLEFVWAEFFAMLAQVLVFTTVFALSSNLMTDKAKTIQILSEKIGGSSISELEKVGAGIAFVTGIVTIITYLFQSFKFNIEDFLSEIPRAIYAFGASSTAACVCSAVFMYANPADSVGVSIADVLKIAGGLLVVSFMYGCVISYLIKRKKLK